MVPSLLENLPDLLHDEEFSDLVNSPPVRIERIVSTGHCSPKDFWYDQEENEWVMVIAGAARLEIEENGKRSMVSLGPGEHRFLPAHRRHRVDWTSDSTATVWLAVWWSEEE